MGCLCCALLDFARNSSKDRGIITTNPCERGYRLYSGSRRDKIWSEDDITSLLSTAPPEIQLALMLAIWTGQRQGDLRRLPWSGYDRTHTRLKQSKTGRRIVMPAGARLKALSDISERRGPVILTNSFGRPWTSDGRPSRICFKRALRQQR